MAFVVREVSDDEIPRVCEIESVSFNDGPLAPILAPGPFPEDGTEEQVEQWIKTRKENSSIRYMQAYDEAAGKMAAFSQWYILDTPEAVATAARPSPPTVIPGKNAEACSLFFSSMVEQKRAILGDKPHIYLRLLLTDPAFQGRGAGSLLMKWGIEKSEELGLPIYLESSEAGYKFYQNRGFKDVEVLEIDFRPHGGPIHKQPLMMRFPGEA